jgi:hypothetical protein
MNNSDQMRSIMEAFYNAAPYGMPGAQDDSTEERVTYSKTQKQGNASITTTANADSMDELHQILKLAGIDKDEPEAHDHDDHEEHDHEEPEMKMDDEECCDDEEPKMKVISLKPQNDQGYNGIGGDKKEILNALMNRYKSL